MPELPEVETIKKQIETYLPFKVSAITTSSFIESIRGGRPKSQFASLKNLVVSKLIRHGKYLFWFFENTTGAIMVSHLGMSGKWLIDTSDAPLLKHTHLRFYGKNFTLSYIDPRRFGEIGVLSSSAYTAKLKKLGPDALSPHLNLAYLQELFSRYPSRSLKKILLDQTALCGIGNYLASEIMVRAHLLPTRELASLTPPDIKNLLRAIKTSINLSIKAQGLTFDGAYRDLHGKAGNTSSSLLVFQQASCGQCKKGQKVVRIVQDGRSTFYCKQCQH
ncbi:MAG: hypothetical protein HQK50_16560 [Oligoflexia bacterium]|nr:hypothetical protein [Oligoflexia bacterium]MBF0367190.1 hypothetical protein [Oligoflexia bacterium]